MHIENSTVSFLKTLQDGHFGRRRGEMVKTTFLDYKDIFMIRMKLLLLWENEQEMNVLWKPAEFNSSHFGRENDGGG